MAKLALELVPSTMWGKNVRAFVSWENWNKLKWEFQSANCAVCGKEGYSRELHEQWQFDDKRCIQRLVGLIEICQDGHLAMHLGRAELIGKAAFAREHLKAVNAWSDQQTDRHISTAFAKWHRRSKRNYSLDLSWLNKWIPETQVHLNWIDQRKVWVFDRLDVIHWAKEALRSNTVIVDTETTGLRQKKSAEVIELAVLSMKGKVLYHSYFRPRYPIPKRTTNIHGITNEFVKSAPRFKTEHETIMNAVHSKVVIAYHANFDREMIVRTCKVAGVEPPDCRWECAMHNYRTYENSPRLLPLPDKQHNAVGDCKAVLKLIKRLARA